MSSYNIMQAGLAHTAGHVELARTGEAIFCHVLPVAPITVAKRDESSDRNCESGNHDKRHWQIAMRLPLSL